MLNAYKYVILILVGKANSSLSYINKYEKPFKDYTKIVPNSVFIENLCCVNLRALEFWIF